MSDNAFTLDPMYQVWGFDSTASVSIELALDEQPIFIIDSPRYAGLANYIGRWDAPTLQEAVEKAMQAIKRIAEVRSTA